MLKTKTTSQQINWTAILRIRVGNSVFYNNKTWVNKTGRNSEPDFNNVDWQVIHEEKEGSAVIYINGNPFYLVKNPANNVPANKFVLENNDFIVNGAWDATEFWLLAVYLGGGQDVKENWQILNRITDL